MKLGTWSTIGCPFVNVTNSKGEIRKDYEATLNIIKEAEQWLRKEFDKIGGKVRVCNNEHDFGTYQSFEIDMPTEIEEVYIEDEDDMNEDEIELWHKREDWLDKANKIEEEYYKQFKNYL